MQSQAGSERDADNRTTALETAPGYEKGHPITLGNPDVMLYRLALFLIELAEMRSAAWHVDALPPTA